MSKPSETSGSCHEDVEQLSITDTSDPSQSSSSSSECWILVQQNDGCGGQFFNRNWNSYREGFGDVSGNYWIGNEHLHQITQLLHQGLPFTIFHKRNNTLTAWIDL